MYYRCPASAITSQKTPEDPIYMTVCDPDKHNHVPNIEKIKTDKAIADAVEKAVENRTVPPRQLMSDVTNLLTREGNYICPVSMVR